MNNEVISTNCPGVTMVKIIKTNRIKNFACLLTRTLEVFNSPIKYLFFDLKFWSGIFCEVFK